MLLGVMRSGLACGRKHELGHHLELAHSLRCTRRFEERRHSGVALVDVHDAQRLACPLRRFPEQGAVNRPSQLCQIAVARKEDD